MGVKIGGFECDKCGKFKRYEEVKKVSKIGHRVQFNEFLDVCEFRIIKDWTFKKIDKINHEWMKIYSNSQCYCLKCARIEKLLKIKNRCKSDKK